MNDSQKPGAGHYVGLGAVAFWTMLSTFIVYAVGYAIEESRLVQTGSALTGRGWLIASLVQALAVLVVTLPLALLVKQPLMRAIYRTWTFAAGGVAAFGLVRLVPPFHHEETALAQIVVALALTALLWRGVRARGQRRHYTWRAVLPALAVGAVTLLPWVVYGALGSWQETVLGSLACLALGVLTGVLLDAGFLGALTQSGGGLGLGGFVAGVTLLLLATGFALPTQPLLLMLSIPALGWVLLAAAHAADPAVGAPPAAPPDAAYEAMPGAEAPAPAARVELRAWLPMAVLMGMAVAGPVLFTDPAEMNIYLSDAAGQDFRAAGFGLLLALLLIGLVPLRRVLALLGRYRTLGALVAVLALGGTLLLQVRGGQPGFYGDRYFVILKEQANVDAAAPLPDRVQRLRTVYTTLTQQADRTQAPIRRTLERLHVPYTPYYLVNGLEVQAGPLVRAWLARRPEVDRIVPSPRLRPLHDPGAADPGVAEIAPTGPVWNMEALGAPRVWQELGVTGKGIVVGQSDSGVDVQHPALRASYRGAAGGDNYNWLDPWYHSKSPVDHGGHGTHTLGTVLGAGGIGVAPGATWFGCSNLVRDLGDPALYLDCLQFMLAPYPQGADPLHAGDPTRAAHVLNNSWGCPPIEGCDPGTLEPAVRALRDAGIFVVVSAGNEGPKCGSVSDPMAIYPEAFSVGAVDKNGKIAGFSSRGPVTVDGSGRVKPDIVAPGVSILSAWPGGGYAIEQGTSMAGPHVAGVVALMWSAQPKLVGNIERTEQILTATARPISGAVAACGGAQNVVGHGMVDAYAAVKAALAER